MKTAFMFVLLGIITNTAAQEPLSTKEILLQGQASYGQTTRLLTTVSARADIIPTFTGELVWARDGERYRIEGTESVEHGGGFTPFSMQQFVSDGRTVWITSTQQSKSGSAPADKEIKFVADGYGANRRFEAGLCLDGVLYGDTEDVFTILLRHIDTVTATPVTLDNRPLIHLTGHAPEGAYELWLDPALGHRIVKSIARKSGDNPLYDSPIRRSAQWSSLEATVTDVTFEDVPGGTLAMSGRMRITGTTSPLSSTSTFPSEEGHLYLFIRSNAKLGAAVSEAELALPSFLFLDTEPAKIEK